MASGRRVVRRRAAYSACASPVSSSGMSVWPWKRCSASNDRQVRAIVDEIGLRMRQAGAELIRREGEREGRWVLLDYNDIVVHVQNKEERVFYALERIWKDCPVIPLPEAATVGNPATSGDAR